MKGKQELTSAVFTVRWFHLDGAVHRIGQVEGVRPDHLEYLHHMDTLGAHVRLVVS
jgi:hypothetical protein